VKFTYADTAHQCFDVVMARSVGASLIDHIKHAAIRLFVYIFSSFKFFQIRMPYLCEGGCVFCVLLSVIKSTRIL